MEIKETIKKHTESLHKHTDLMYESFRALVEIAKMDDDNFEIMRNIDPFSDEADELDEEFLEKIECYISALNTLDDWGHFIIENIENAENVTRAFMKAFYKMKAIKYRIDSKRKGT